MPPALPVVMTPTVEVDLCGHATLATAHTVWEAGFAPADRPLRFSTRSGAITCVRLDDWIELDFPATPPAPADPADGLLDALGVRPSFVGRSRFDYLLLLDSEAAVRSVRPDFLTRIKNRPSVQAYVSRSDGR